MHTEFSGHALVKASTLPDPDQRLCCSKLVITPQHPTRAFGQEVQGRSAELVANPYICRHSPPRWGRTPFLAKRKTISSVHSSWESLGSLSPSSQQRVSRACTTLRIQFRCIYCSKKRPFRSWCSLPDQPSKEAAMVSRNERGPFAKGTAASRNSVWLGPKS